MATGYTHCIGDGDGVTFEAFALQCARAFGALVMMRDDPMDATIPDAFEPSDYNIKGLAKARARLAELHAMTTADAHAAALAEWEEAKAYEAKCEAEMAVLRERYTAMLASIDAWEPPTPDHNGLRRFMREQVVMSIDHDCTGDYHRAPAAPPSAAHWLANATAKARHDIEYHTNENAKEVKRAAERTAWVKALRDSLATFAVPLPAKE